MFQVIFKCFLNRVDNALQKDEFLIYVITKKKERIAQIERNTVIPFEIEDLSFFSLNLISLHPSDEPKKLLLSFGKCTNTPK